MSSFFCMHPQTLLSYTLPYSCPPRTVGNVVPAYLQLISLSVLWISTSPTFTRAPRLTHISSQVLR